MSRALTMPLQILFSLLAALPLAWAQGPSVIPLVPAANWRQASALTVSLDEVRRHGGDPVVDREYGVKSLEHRTYQLGRQMIDVFVEEASDASSAYGLFTYYQNEKLTPEKGMQLTVSGPEGALMARGRFFIWVTRPSNTQVSDNDFRALMIFIAGTRSSKQALAGLPSPMPTTGLVVGSEKFLQGLEVARRVLPSFRTDLIGFTQGAEAQVADYQAGHARSTILVVSYPTPQIARRQFGVMEKLLGVNQDHGEGSLYGRRSGSFVFMVLNSDSPAAAGKLMDEFTVSNQISWDELYPGDKPFSIQLLELILGNAALVLLLMMFAIVGGLLIVLSRRVAARWFPESPWGHPAEGSIITLNLK
jgi:hypothetical protein